MPRTKYVYPRKCGCGFVATMYQEWYKHTRKCETYDQDFLNNKNDNVKYKANHKTDHQTECKCNPKDPSALKSETLKSSSVIDGHDMDKDPSSLENVLYLAKLLEYSLNTGIAGDTEYIKTLFFKYDYR